MPFQHKTPGILAAEIEMHRRVHAGAFLIVEGKDDLRFWRRWRHSDCELIEGEGKDKVVNGVRRLDSRGVRGVLGVVDSDYDTFKGEDLPSTNLVATDAHDLECVLCRSQALEAVLAEHGDPSKIQRFEDDTGVAVRQSLLDRALAFGRVRLAATLWDETQVMPELRVPRFLDEMTWIVDGTALMDAVVARSGRDRETWENRVISFAGADPWFVARGHDMVEILRIGLRKVLGDIGTTVGRDDIARDLRLAVSREYLEATGLWAGVRTWQDINHPYAILPTSPPHGPNP